MEQDQINNSSVVYQYVFYLLHDEMSSTNLSNLIMSFTYYGVTNVIAVSELNELQNYANRILASRNFVVCSALLAEKIDLSMVSSIKAFSGILLYCGPHEEYYCEWAAPKPEIIFMTHNTKELRRAALWLASGGSFSSIGDPTSESKSKDSIEKLQKISTLRYNKQQNQGKLRNNYNSDKCLETNTVYKRIDKSNNKHTNDHNSWLFSSQIKHPNFYDADFMFRNTNKSIKVRTPRYSTETTASYCDPTIDYVPKSEGSKDCLDLEQIMALVKVLTMKE